MIQLSLHRKLGTPPSPHVTELGSFSYAYLGNSPAPTSRTLGSINTAWTYELNVNDRRLKGINHSLGRDYDYASNGVRITSVTTTPSAAGGTAVKDVTTGVDLTYDDADHLTRYKVQPKDVSNNPTGTATNWTYAYDKLDNFTSFTNTAASSVLTPTKNNANQQTGFGGTFTYDTEGNLASEPSRTYLWDIENRLGEIDFVGTPPATQKVTFQYDALGRRARMFTTTGGATVETRYLWSGSQLVHARNSSNVVTRRYYVEGEQRIGTGADKLIYNTDHLGSVRDVVSINTSAVVGSRDYSPYGGVKTETGTKPDFTYAGLLFEPTSGLLMSKTRLYNGFIGHWLNRDPIEERGGMNLYAYTAGNPLNFTDASGLAGQSVLNLLRSVKLAVVYNAVKAYDTVKQCFDISGSVNSYKEAQQKTDKAFAITCADNLDCLERQARQLTQGKIETVKAIRDLGVGAGQLMSPAWSLPPLVDAVPAQ